MAPCASMLCLSAAFTNHGNKVQEVHPRLVGLGVGQREEGRQLKAHSISCVASLRITEERMKKGLRLASFEKCLEITSVKN